MDKNKHKVNLTSFGNTAEQVSFLSSLLQSVADTIIQIDPNGLIIYINRVDHDHLIEDVIGSHWLNLVTDDQHKRVETCFEKTLNTGQTTEFETNQIRGESERLWHSSRMSPVYKEEAIVGVVLVKRDISKSKLTNIRLEDKLVQSERLVSLGTLAAGIGHEINNPLCYAILGLNLVQTDLMEMTSVISEEKLVDFDKRIRVVHKGLQRIAAIVKSMRVFAHPEDLEDVGKVDVRECLQDALELVRAETTPCLKVLREYEGPVFIKGNATKLVQLFTNLFMNAVQSMEIENVDKNTIHIETKLDVDGKAHVLITDNGCGIPPEVLDKIFDPFFTTRPVGMGSGLGLHICHEIIVSMGGKISIDSQVGIGTKVLLRFPLIIENKKEIF